MKLEAPVISRFRTLTTCVVFVSSGHTAGSRPCSGFLRSPVAFVSYAMMHDGYVNPEGIRSVPGMGEMLDPVGLRLSH